MISVYYLYKIDRGVRKNWFQRQKIMENGSFWLIFAQMANLAMEIELIAFNLLRSVKYPKLTGEFKKTSFGNTK